MINIAAIIELCPSKKKKEKPKTHIKEINYS